MICSELMALTRRFRLFFVHIILCMLSISGFCAAATIRNKSHYTYCQWLPHYIVLKEIDNSLTTPRRFHAVERCCCRRKKQLTTWSTSTSAFAILFSSTNYDPVKLIRHHAEGFNLFYQHFVVVLSWFLGQTKGTYCSLNLKIIWNRQFEQNKTVRSGAARQKTNSSQFYSNSAGYP